MNPTARYGSLSVTTVECHYVYEEFAAVYLLKHDRTDDVAVVDTNTEKAIPHVESALKALGLGFQNVTHILVTHAHLDHAAGTSSLLSRCPRAKVYAHPKAARHLIDPTKLVTSARAVYGAERFEKLYGNIGPIAKERIVALDHDSTIDWSGEKLLVLHTLGHATHHVVYFTPESRVLFSGDTFGVHYPRLQHSGVFMFPSTSPTDFDAEEALKTIETLRALQPAVVYPTHYDRITEVQTAAAQMREHYLFFQSLRDRARLKRTELPQSPDLHRLLERWILAEIKTYVVDFLARNHLTFDEKDWAVLDLDIELNAQGVAYCIFK